MFADIAIAASCACYGCRSNPKTRGDVAYLRASANCHVFPFPDSHQFVEFIYILHEKFLGVMFFPVRNRKPASCFCEFIKCVTDPNGG